MNDPVRRPRQSAALILNPELRGPGLHKVLGALGKSAREEVDMRQRVMAGRASTRRTVQMVVRLGDGLRAGPRGLQPRLRRAVRHGARADRCSPGVLFGPGFWWLRKLSKIETPDRFLVTARTSPGSRWASQPARPIRRGPDGRVAGSGCPMTIFFKCLVGALADAASRYSAEPGDASRRGTAPVAQIDALRAQGQSARRPRPRTRCAGPWASRSRGSTRAEAGKSARSAPT